MDPIAPMVILSTLCVLCDASKPRTSASCWLKSNHSCIDAETSGRVHWNVAALSSAEPQIPAQGCYSSLCVRVPLFKRGVDRWGHFNMAWPNAQAQPRCPVTSSSETASRCPCLTCTRCENRPDQYMLQLRRRSVQWVAKRRSRQHHLVIKGSFGFDWSVCGPTTSAGLLTRSSTIIQPWPFVSSDENGWILHLKQWMRLKERRKNTQYKMLVLFMKVYEVQWKFECTATPKKTKSKLSQLFCEAFLLNILFSFTELSREINAKSICGWTTKIRYCFFSFCDYLNWLHVLNYSKSS